MVRYTYFIALLFIVVARTHFTHGIEIFNLHDEKCLSYHEVCSDLEKARSCKSYEWCKQQVINCEAKKLLIQQFPYFRQLKLQELESDCTINYKKLYGLLDSEDMDIQVKPGRESFTLSLNFKGDPESEIPKHDVSVKINDKLVYSNKKIA